MNVLIADKFPESGRESLAALGLNVTYVPDASADKLVELVSNHSILLVRSTKVPESVLRAATELELVVRAGAGVNTIDVKTASSLGIFVANCPGKNAIAVAELAIGMLIALDRRLALASHDLKQGSWKKQEYSKAEGLFGRTLGVVGLGDIGCAVAQRAQALGMHVVAWSRSLAKERARALDVEWVSNLEALATRCDAVSVHVALTPETRGLLGEKFLQKLKKNVLFVNTSRDGIVDEAAVIAAIESRGLRYAADVFDGEPAGGVAEFHSPVANHPQTLVTPHIGASTEQAQAAVAAEAVRIVESFLREGRVPNCVNLCRQSPARYQLNVRHLDKVGVLANVLTAVREAGINVEEVENIIFDGAQAACARIRLAEDPGSNLVTTVRGVAHVLGVQLVRLA